MNPSPRPFLSNFDPRARTWSGRGADRRSKACVSQSALRRRTICRSTTGGAHSSAKESPTSELFRLYCGVRTHPASDRSGRTPDAAVRPREHEAGHRTPPPTRRRTAALKSFRTRSGKPSPGQLTPFPCGMRGRPPSGTVPVAERGTRPLVEERTRAAEAKCVRSNEREAGGERYAMAPERPKGRHCTTARLPCYLDRLYRLPERRQAGESDTKR